MRTKPLIALIVAGATLGAVVLATTGYLLWPTIARIASSQPNIDDAASDLPAAVAAYRAAGLPWTAAELEKPLLRVTSANCST